MDGCEKMRWDVAFSYIYDSLRSFLNMGHIEMGREKRKIFFSFSLLYRFIMNGVMKDGDDLRSWTRISFLFISLSLSLSHI
jgi:hypothetical protein